MKFLREILIKVFIYSKRIGQWFLKFLINNKKIVLWICVPTVLMIIWEVGKWIFMKLKQQNNVGSNHRSRWRNNARNR